MQNATIQKDNCAGFQTEIEIIFINFFLLLVIQSSFSYQISSWIVKIVFDFLSSI